MTRTMILICGIGAYFAGISVWANPLMSMTQLVLSIGFTAYIPSGLWFEERDLVREHGDEYLRYRQETGSLLPKFGG